MTLLFRKLRRKPLRTFLTLLQIVLGSLAMTLALSAYLDAYQRQQAGKPERFDLVASSSSEQGGAVVSKYALFDEEGLKQVLKLSPAAEKIAFVGDAQSSSTIEKDGKLYQFNEVAYINEDYFELNDTELTSGSFFTSQDEGKRSPVVLISDGAAKILFGNTSALGQTLTFLPDTNYVVYDEDGNARPAVPPETYNVIGTFAQSSAFQTDTQYSAFLPSWKKTDFSDGYIANVLAKSGQGEAAREQVVTASRQVFSSKISDWGLEKDETFVINELGQSWWASPDQNAMLEPTVIMFGLFGVIALIVGSIGIFSITLVDILERQRDTGIKRALGATRGTITREMVLESAFVAGLGGLLGILLAAFIIPWLNAQLGDSFIWNVNLKWQPAAATAVFILTVFLGGTLGFFPAFRAAHIKPVEALKGV